MRRSGTQALARAPRSPLANKHSKNRERFVVKLLPTEADARLSRKNDSGKTPHQTLGRRTRHTLHPV